MTTISRRRLLAAAAAAPAIGAFLTLVGTARAAQDVVTVSQSVSEAESSCGTASSHAALIAEAERGMSAMSPAERATALSAMSCPICGCPLAPR